jgi:glycosyltransferase involved in cell wall biosynthesis
LADALIALTAEEVGYLTGPNGASPSKITVVPVGVDLTTFTPHGPALPRLARPRLVTVGRLVARKGVQAVIEAVAALPRSLDVELKIAGGPARADLSTDPIVRSLRDHARKHAILDRVEFLGRIPHARVPELLRSADVFVCAPHYEPFGTAALEAAACGRPVVATAVGGLREHIIDGETGRLVPLPHDDPAALASALAELVTNPRQRAQFGTAGAQRAARYAWPRVAGEILTVYRSVPFSA